MYPWVRETDELFLCCSSPGSLRFETKLGDQESNVDRREDQWATCAQEVEPRTCRRASGAFGEKSVSLSGHLLEERRASGLFEQ